MGVGDPIPAAEKYIWEKVNSKSTHPNKPCNLQPSCTSLKELELPKGASKKTKTTMRDQLPGLGQDQEEEQKKKKKVKLEEQGNKEKDETIFHSLKSFHPSGFKVFYYFPVHGQHDHLSMRNKLYEDIKGRGKWYKDKNHISNIPLVLKRIKFDFSGPCSTSNWMSIPTSGDLIFNKFQAPVFLCSQNLFPHF
ncbi:hypothetical protein VP01_3303g2 [Puccinia sorghi]|uniref:Uncharacterized protein n=1 Tax=Puccinia sorghi TaxID=27349 RepID=A0A0L6UY92_9BASI|nr:hypothetical protein VP01_3303g2 [Puccinia sorghi]